MFKSGDLIDGKYRVLSIVGSGGMGHVYRVQHIHLRSIRCIKVLKPTLAADATFRQRFVREAVVATQVSHGSVASVFDFAELPDGTLYMVSEFVDGLSLREMINRLGPMPTGVAAGLCIEVLEGLSACHNKGILHRDISPDNIMLTLGEAGELRARIIDLGIAKIAQGKTGDLTQTGLYLGNPRYSSPEQLGNLDEDEEIDGRTDVYSLGVVLCEMVTGARPFKASTPQGYAVKHLTEQAPPLSMLNPNLTFSPAFERVVEKSLEKARLNRWSSAFDFSAALSAFASAWKQDEYALGASRLISDVANERSALELVTQPGTEPVPTIGVVTRTEVFEERQGTVTGEGPRVAGGVREKARKFWLAVAAVVLVLVIGFLSRSRWLGTPVEEVHRADESQMTRETAAYSTYRVLVESVPSAALSEIRTSDGAAVDWQEADTPVWIDLATGQYELVIVNRSLGLTKEIPLAVPPSGKGPIRVVLATPSAEQYFAETGW